MKATSRVNRQMNPEHACMLPGFIMSIYCATAHARARYLASGARSANALFLFSYMVRRQTDHAHPKDAALAGEYTL